MKWFVYILQFTNWKLYDWSTNDIDRRLKEHKSWSTKSLKQLWLFDLLKKYEFEDIVTARKVEYFIKKQKSRKFIERILNDEVNIYGLLA